MSYCDNANCFVFVLLEHPDPRLLGPTTGQLRITGTAEKSKEEKTKTEK